MVEVLGNCPDRFTKKHMMQIRKCCCLSLRTGSLILGYFHTISYAVAVTALSLMFYQPFNENGDIDDSVVKKRIIAIIVIAAILLLFSCLLLAGVHSGKPNYMLPWLISKFIMMILGSILTVMSTGTVLVALFESGKPDLIIAFILGPLSMFIFWYLYFVVYSHYRELTEGPQHQRFFNRNISDQQDFAIVTKT